MALLLIAQAAYGAAGCMAACWADVSQPSSLSLNQAVAAQTALLGRYSLFRICQNVFRILTHSLQGQFFPGCHPLVVFSFAEVPAGICCGAGVRLS